MTLADTTFIFALACLLIASWSARKALQMSREAAFWQQCAGENAEKAAKWDLHLAACRRGGQTAAERQRAPVLAMAEKLRGGE